MPPHQDLGSLLVEENVLAQKDLDRLDGTRGPRPLWQALLDGKLITEDELFYVLAQRYGAPVLSDEVIAEAHMPAQENLRRALTRDQALASGMLPIDFSTDQKRVTVLMVDPSDESSLAAFLTRAQVPEGRAILGRASAIVRAIERCYGKAPLASSKGVVAQVPTRKVDHPTGTIKIDPELQAEIARLQPDATQRVPGLPARETGPVPRPRSRRATPQPVAATETEPDVQRLDERLIRTLLQAVEVLARELELRLVGVGDDPGRLLRPGSAAEMARLARRVALELNLSRRAAEEIGLAAQLHIVDRLLRNVDGTAAPDLPGELGWPAAGEGGLVPILRALAAASAGFGKQTTPSGSSPLGARIIAVVADYLALGVSATEADLETVSQLLRASAAGAAVVDALLRVLESERADRTPEANTVIMPAPATSLLKDSSEKE